MHGNLAHAVPQSRAGARQAGTPSRTRDLCVRVRAVGPSNDIPGCWTCGYPPALLLNRRRVCPIGPGGEDLGGGNAINGEKTCNITTRASVRCELLPILCPDHRVPISRPPPLYFPPLLVDCATWDSGRTPRRRPRDQERWTNSSTPEPSSEDPDYSHSNPGHQPRQSGTTAGDQEPCSTPERVAPLSVESGLLDHGPAARTSLPPPATPGGGTGVIVARPGTSSRPTRPSDQDHRPGWRGT